MAFSDHPLAKETEGDNLLDFLEGLGTVYNVPLSIDFCIQAATCLTGYIERTCL